MEQEQTEEFKLESFEEIVILENTSDKRNDHFIRLTREQMKEELEFACSKDELSFKSPKSEEIENIELIDHVIFVSQPDDNNDDAEGQQEDYLVHDKHRSDMISFTFPSSVVFNIASIDAQHTLWEVPDALSGKEYISFLGRRHWDYYFKTLNVTTLYWNYDLHSIINKHIPKHQEQARQSSAKLSTEFSTNRLLGESRNIISDTHLTTEWSYVTNDRDARNTVAKYVGGNAAHFSLQQGKTLIINSEYMKDKDNVHVIPQLYTRDNEGLIKRLPMIDRK